MMMLMPSNHVTINYEVNQNKLRKGVGNKKNVDEDDVERNEEEEKLSQRWHYSK